MLLPGFDGSLSPALAAQLRVGTMHTETFADILRYGGIISQVIAAVSCLAGDSNNAVTNAASKVITTHPQQQAALPY